MSDLTFASPSRSNDGSLALVSCLSGGYRFVQIQISSPMRRSSSELNVPQETLVCVWEDLQAPPAPHFVFLITL